MAQATFVHEGLATDYTPTADVAAGDVVVQEDLVGVAKTPIKANELGALAVAGVFDFAKTAGDTFTVGTVVYWDDAAKVVTATAASNKLAGKVVRAAASDDATVRVRLTQ
jgi:predicted RecA/RadA family phage recombinase